ncbi:MAG: 50S ribosomal protein L23 [Woeseiaceae bacterium]|jgi:large subunit ribosomal protein L23|nr:50S ribosomal protein L23 [Woeseiaceae bacterium]|tara:strand:- start:2809 stop:3126 length:318 start_codon:yes stop_codon:yes gene_type:complete
MNDSTNHQERLLTIIVGPHLSEKTTVVAEKLNQTVFKVRVDANKKEIKQAVEHLFEVKVENVTTINYKGKTKGRGKMVGKRSNWKKAYVTLAMGSQIDFLGAENS